MRLVRLGRQVSEVGADVRAAFASWGRGDSVVGGLAVTGCQPPGCPRPADAVMLLPRGIIVVVGVDLPDPAMRLDAPLSGQWKTDGWPLIRPDGAVNPAIDALGVSEALARRLADAGVEPLPVGTVVAVGPYVSQVLQPTSDLARGVRILHPEPMTLLTAARELAVYQRRCSVDGARQILAVLQPDLPPLTAEDLVAEGFIDAVSAGVAAAETTVIPRIIAGPLAGAPPSASRRSDQLRWIPVVAAILVGLLLIIGIVFAVASAGSEPTARTSRAAGHPDTDLPEIDGVRFEPKGAISSEGCAPHASGDLRVALTNNPCRQLLRLRFESTSNGHRAAVLVAVLRFSDSTTATELHRVADQPGSGAVSDVVTEGVAWPGDHAPVFEPAAFASGREGNSVKLVRAVWLDQPSTPDDPELVKVATRALQLPAPS